MEGRPRTIPVKVGLRMQRPSSKTNAERRQSPTSHPANFLARSAEQIPATGGVRSAQRTGLLLRPLPPLRLAPLRATTRTTQHRRCRRYHRHHQRRVRLPPPLWSGFARPTASLLPVRNSQGLPMNRCGVFLSFFFFFFFSFFFFFLKRVVSPSVLVRNINSFATSVLGFVWPCLRVRSTPQSR